MTEREPFRWTSRLGPKATLLVAGWSIPGITVDGREITGTAAKLGELAAMLDADGTTGKRAAAKIRRDVYEAVVVVGLLNPVLGLQAIADLRTVLGSEAHAIPPELQALVDAYLRRKESDRTVQNARARRPIKGT